MMNYLAIARLLDITRSKNIRSRCKAAQTQAAALSSVLSKFLSKRQQCGRTNLKRKVSIHPDEKHKIEMKSALPTRPHVGKFICGDKTTLEIATGGIERVCPPKRRDVTAYPVQEIIPTGTYTMNILEPLARQYNVRSVSVEAANLLAQVVKVWILSRIMPTKLMECRNILEIVLLPVPKPSVRVR